MRLINFKYEQDIIDQKLKFRPFMNDLLLTCPTHVLLCNSSITCMIKLEWETTIWVSLNANKALV